MAFAVRSSVCGLKKKNTLETLETDPLCPWHANLWLKYENYMQEIPERGKRLDGPSISHEEKEPSEI